MMNRSRRAVGRHSVLHVAARDDDACAVAVIASRKVGNAVQRNRAKRVIRAALTTISFTPGNSLVVIARAQAARSSMATVAQELQDLAAQCGVVGCQSVAK